VAALTALAAHVRREANPFVVAITGSVGKTTTKDLTAAVLRRRFRTVAALRSFNNDLGVPLTLLRAGQETDLVICEMGTRGPGHIARLCECARPQMGIVTNVGVTHYEMFGSVEGIAEAKSELIRALPYGGTAVLNADDGRVLAMASLTDANILTFGTGADAEVKATGIKIDPRGRPSFDLGYGSRKKVPVHMPLAGVHQVPNALAASAAAIALGMSLPECRSGLEAARPASWRMEVTEDSGIIFVNDAYNASPSSMSSALNTCSAMVPSGGRLLAVLGYMAELGDISVTEHRRVGSLAAAVCSVLITCGGEAGALADGAEAAGMKDVRRAASAGGALGMLGPLKAGDVLLVKGSRAAGLEDFVDHARARPGISA
ncbi:MAG: UDP-N-acetylmuramoyl-tripeptide--D-alanyl-D-alanine ligase, partial [Actinomycetota bacterium]